VQTPPIPDDEAERVESLRKLGLLDTPAEERFDRLTRLARKVFGVPIALVSLVDAQRQWFKSSQGLDATQTSRDISFCGHAIVGSDALVVPDAAHDDRFHDNPLVTGDPRIRFYAGQPIHAPDGRAIGTLCIIDRAPREFGPAELTLLEDLARVVEGEFERDRLGEEQRRLREVLSETERRASVDGLTRVWNRAFTMALLERELDVMRRRKTPLSVCFVDVDHFKTVNDTHGHPAGDAVLMIIAERLRRASRSDDAIGRWGGEEFLLLLPNTPGPVAALVAERARAAIASEPVTAEGVALSVTVSIGVCTIVDAAQTGEALVKGADEALYAAKSAGRNRVAVSNPA